MNDFIDKFNSYPLGQRVLGLIGIMGLLVAAFYFSLYSPVRSTIDSKQAELSNLQVEQARLAELKRKRSQVIARIETLERQLMIAQEQLPQSDQIPSLLQRIHNQAKTAGLDIDRFERMEDVMKEHYVEIPVQMDLSGTYDELANFFFYVGRMTRIVNVRDISLKRGSKGMTAEGELKVTALATTFRYKRPEEAGAQAGGAP
jgi:type IV pilus assembly protein PilO